MITLAVTSREKTGSKAARLIRKEGKVPGILYGAHRAATPIALDRTQLEAALRHGGETSLIELTGLETPVQALIHELEYHPAFSAPFHVDLLAVKKGEKVVMSLPLSFVGESEAVRLGANLVKVMHELEIEATPDKLPHEIEVDVSTLVNVGDRIHAGSIRLPAGVSLVTDADEVVALAQEPAGEEPEAPVLDMDAIEVEQKGKSEEAE